MAARGGLQSLESRPCATEISAAEVAGDGLGPLDLGSLVYYLVAILPR